MIETTAIPKPVARLEGWSYNGYGLEGNVLDHPRFNDGDYVYTSLAIGLLEGQVPKEGDVVETLNTFYKLGEPDFPLAVKESVRAALAAHTVKDRTES